MSTVTIYCPHQKLLPFVPKTVLSKSFCYEISIKRQDANLHLKRQKEVSLENILAWFIVGKHRVVILKIFCYNNCKAKKCANYNKFCD